MSLTSALLARLKFSNGAVVVNPKPGPQTLGRNRFLKLDNTGTREKAEWPAGSNITELTFFAIPVDGTTAVNGDEYIVVSVDASTDAAADAALTQTESATADAKWFPITLNTLVRMPLAAALVNGTLSGGRVDAKTVGGLAIDLWIGGN